MKVAIVYYSGTGNTEEMAKILEGALMGKADVEVFTSDSFDADPSAFDAILFGCPAMGNEVLEEESFEPMFSSLEGKLEGKKVGLFGSYGWGDGEWMRNWEDRVKEDGMNLVGSVIANEAPDDIAKKELEDLALSIR